MATKTYTDYKKEAEEASKALKEEDIKLANDQAAENERLINENYETQLAETREGYEDLFRKNEVQKVLNERYFDRKAAEMGLSDSGFSRTRQTANQLNYANTNAEYEKNKQKAEDTLAAAMRAKITENELNRRQNVQSIESSYDTAASKTASDNYKEYLESLADSETDADKEYKDLYNTIYKEYRNNNTGTDPVTGLPVAMDGKKTTDYHYDWIYDYQIKNGEFDLNSSQMTSLLGAAGISKEEYEKYFNTHFFALDNIEAVNAYVENGGIIPATQTEAADKFYNSLAKEYGLGRSKEEILADIKNLQSELTKIKNNNGDTAAYLFLPTYYVRLGKFKSELEAGTKAGWPTPIDVGQKYSGKLWLAIENSGLSFAEQNYIAEKFGLNVLGDEKYDT